MSQFIENSPRRSQEDVNSSEADESFHTIADSSGSNGVLFASRWNPMSYYLQWNSTQGPVYWHKAINAALPDLHDDSQQFCTDAMKSIFYPLSDVLYHRNGALIRMSCATW